MILPDVKYVEILTEEKRQEILLHLVFCKTYFEKNNRFVERVLVEKLIHSFTLLRSRIDRTLLRSTFAAKSQGLKSCV